MRALLILILSFLSSCRENLSPTPTMVFEKKYFVEGVNTNGRIFYIHYLNGNADALNNGYFGQLKREMIAKGYQVITFNCPDVVKASFADKGTKYRKNFLDYLDWLIAATDTDLGVAQERIVGGISFGGLHSLIAMSETNYFNRFFTVIGVINPSILPKFGGADMSEFSAIGIENKLSGAHGVMTWGDADNFIDPALSRNLQNQLSTTVSGLEVHGIGHEMNQAMVDSIIQWL